MYNISVLSREQIKEVYEESMLVDFPDNERKPLSMIMKALDKGAYNCLGIIENAKVLGYAFFVKNHNDYLFDYLAVLNGKRNNGLGSFFLKHIADYYKDADSIIGEVEDPSCAKTEEDRVLQERRYNFYLRNGFVDTGVKANVFGADFILIEMNLGRTHSQDEIKKLYLNNYKSFLPRLMYYRKVKIKK